MNRIKTPWEGYDSAYYSGSPYYADHSIWFRTKNAWFNAKKIKSDNPLPIFLELIKFNPASQEDTALTSYLCRSYLKENVAEQETENYQIKMNSAKGWFLPGNQKIYADMPYQFILYRGNNVLATAGFTGFEKGIVIAQIQGKAGRQTDLKPLKWTHLLTDITERWAKNTGLERIAILPAERNKWFEVQNERNNKKLIYDVTAERRKYSYDEKLGLYIKNIKEINLN